MVESTYNKVDFPQPDFPITAINSPAFTEKLTSFNTCTVRGS
jgi:hypothetical protein